MSFDDLPKFDELEDKKRYWTANPGSREEGLGTSFIPRQGALLNTEQVCLNWEMTRLETPGFNRFPCEHQIVEIPNYEGIAWDDIWRFNPQASSQWDGFRHFSTQMDDGTRRWYGGTTADDITSGKSDRIGIGHWAQDGIAARGFLIDYVSYAEKKGIEVNGMNGHAITLEEVLEIAKECKIEFKPGDIFFMRVGFVKTWEASTLEQKKEYRASTNAHKHRHTGLMQGEDVARFVWDNRIVAVAGDGVSFEVRPTRNNDWSMHNYCLAGWGLPIGEMFDMERLAALCKKLNRWTFFVTSSPLNHPQAVSSPPNAMAIF